jgi:hypothetical protein
MLNRTAKKTTTVKKKKTTEETPALWGGSAIQQIYEQMSQQSNQGDSLFLPEFWLKDREGAFVQVVDDEPFNAYVHSIDRTSKAGKPYNVNKTCLGEGCYYCEMAAEEKFGVKKASLKCHVTMLDSREFPLEKDGAPLPWTRRIARMSARRIGPLIQNRAIRRRRSLRGVLLYIDRVGQSTDTVWSFTVLTPEDVMEDADLLESLGDWEPTGQERMGTTESGIEFSFAPCPEFSGDQIPEAFNYAEILKPDTREEAMSFLGNAAAPQEDRPSKGSSIAAKIRATKK